MSVQTVDLKRNLDKLKAFLEGEDRLLFIKAVTEAAKEYNPLNPSTSSLDLKAQLEGKVLYSHQAFLKFPQNDEEKMEAIFSFLEKNSCEGRMAKCIEKHLSLQMAADKGFRKAILDLTDEHYTRFPAPPGDGLSPEEWAIKLLQAPYSLLAVGRKKIALFESFPPEYVDYYKALQEKIAEQIPQEQDRPLICLRMQGGNTQGDVVCNIGLAGGTGPLSDASALESIVKECSELSHDNPISENRELIREKMKNFSALMYSMPPPRDLEHAQNDGFIYRSLYKKVREDFPCLSLHILTNTGHTNQWIFDNELVFGSKALGKVDDMTVQVADKIKRQAGDNQAKVLVLGTIAADKARLYPKLLEDRGLVPVLPASDKDKKYLQHLIDQAKAGRVNAKISENSDRTWGEAFVDFVVEHKGDTKYILFSCTELPMILHMPLPGGEKTYFDLLKEKLGEGYQYYDSEEIFVDIIAQKSKKMEEESVGIVERPIIKSFLFQLFFKPFEVKSEVLPLAAAVLLAPEVLALGAALLAAVSALLVLKTVFDLVVNSGEVVTEDAKNLGMTLVAAIGGGVLAACSPLLVLTAVMTRSLSTMLPNDSQPLESNPHF